jgi:carbon monoxide dehydrogenase subunit G
MALRIQGQVQVDAPRERVWAYLFDEDRLKEMAAKVPGVTVERLVKMSEDKYEGTATLGVAMIKGKYDGTITVVEKRAPEFVKWHADGKNGSNWAGGDLSLTLQEQDGKTLMQYEGMGNVGGTLASVGQRLIDTVGKHFIQYGTKALAEELATRGEAAPEAEADKGGPA